MVRTRSCIEVRLTEKHDDEDEIIIEDDNVVEEEEMKAAEEGEDDDVAEEEEMGTTGEQEQNNLYTVILYYGGHFIHVPFQSYTSNVKRIFKGIDFENLDINESMDELLREQEQQQTQGINDLDTSFQKAQQEEQRNTRSGMKFMPTPSLRKHVGTGSTPPVSTPPTRKEQVKKKIPRKRVAASSKAVKAFAPPRKK